MSEVREGGMLLLKVELTIALSNLKRVATRFAACERGKKVMLIYCISYFPARILRGILSLLYKLYAIYTIQLCSREDHMAWFVCMHCIILLFKSGVLQTCQHCNKQQYNSIQQTELAIRKIFSHSQTIILALFQFKTATPSTTCIGKCD